VECPVETVPLLQKDIIRRSMERGTFVITATQMLESMTSSETPTRAEVSDVANAILDGTDAVMLSGETAVGKHPAAAVATMDRIARAVEGHVHLDGLRVPRASLSPSDFVSAVARSGVERAELAGARALIPFTATGRTAALLSAVRPSIPMFALTYHDAVCRRLNFYRGVFAQRIP
ncbi:MAG: pyruvate kinase, partial [Gemmatimonadetes bacterium]|nr:pyruvate kinase [Gemmatimonadota bacterium]